ncbi:FAD-dependent oxidoreductase [Stieleria sp. JC731]|uniref:glycerol-3-phosphate dehydrogenase/oxidase n=1 Tax=Pirellulaceae TaxID=2691357 RepID=UPI001E418EA0|nr:FAD-dependent oxidoreductase [Stieleria sp. JC731]MCC9602090.1 FAD-dependent oxidoreductase [Stieleria sp. JC731]
MTIQLDRATSIEQISTRCKPWDIAIIGGGATGVGIAMDAASRGLDVVLLERLDFGSGTSSRSTKLVHGGVRYLKQGNVTLVYDALQERTLLKNNAPHLVHDRAFVIPCKNLREWLFYGVGLKAYDALSVRNSFGRSHFVSANSAIDCSPGLRKELLYGGVVYHDGQFDDTRLLINMLQTAAECGACVANYINVDGLLKSDQGQVNGVTVTDIETGSHCEVLAKSVINAAGPFCDEVRRMDQADSEAMVAASQGIHLVLPIEFFPGDRAMIVPKTSDGRVIFIVPWHGHAIVGTTDTAIPKAVEEPSAQKDEIQFLLDTASQYLTKTPTVNDVLSVFTGIRPLVKADKSSKTSSLSRDHVIRISDSGLVTITGGKWTTVRKMAEDCVDQTIAHAGLNQTPCRTKDLAIHAATSAGGGVRSHYGTDLIEIEKLEQEHPDLAERIDAALPIYKSEVVWATRYEMARGIDDVLARRTRALFLNTAAARRAAPMVASLMANELNLDQNWVEKQLEKFEALAKHYDVKSLMGL